MCDEANNSVCGAEETTEQIVAKPSPKPSKETKDDSDVVPDVPNAPII